MRIVQAFTYIMIIITAPLWAGFAIWVRAIFDLKSVREDIRRILRGK